MSDSCWFLNSAEPVKVTLVYVHPTINNDYQDLARRFVSTFKEHPPEYASRLVVVCNGANPSDASRAIFSGMPVELIPRGNEGFDWGAYQFAARTFPCELMVFFGASTYFRRTGWLKRMVESYQKHGETLYGAMSNYGSRGQGCYPHLRSTAMWTTPELFNAYPHKVTDPSHRYPAEHGPNCITGWVAREGMIPLAVTFAGIYEWAEWTSIPGGFHNGKQEHLLVGDRMSCPGYYPFA